MADRIRQESKKATTVLEQVAQEELDQAAPTSATSSTRTYALQHEIDTQPASITKCEQNLRSFLELRGQAVRDKASEVLTNDRVERLFNDLVQAPGIIERIFQERREELINKFREV